MIISTPNAPATGGSQARKTVAEILSGRTDYRAERQVEMLAKDKLSMDNFDMAYEQLPDIRKSLVDLAYLRDLRKPREPEVEQELDNNPLCQL